MGLAQDMAGAGMNNLGARLLMSSSRQALADRAGMGPLSNEALLEASRVGLNSRDLRNSRFDGGRWLGQGGGAYVSPGDTFNYQPMLANNRALAAALRAGGKTGGPYDGSGMGGGGVPSSAMRSRNMSGVPSSPDTGIGGASMPAGMGDEYGSIPTDGWMDVPMARPPGIIGGQGGGGPGGPQGGPQGGQLAQTPDWAGLNRRLYPPPSPPIRGSYGNARPFFGFTQR